jgi:hypothetical protein
MIIAFCIFAVFYILVSIKVTQWQTICRCGFKSEAPEFYLRYPVAYHYFSWAFFLIALIFALIQYPPWLLAPIMAVLFFISGIVGRRLALIVLREVLADIASHSKNVEEKTDISEKIKMKDQDLLNHFIQ